MPRGRKFTPNQIEIDGDVARLYLPHKDGSESICLIDASAVDRVSQYRWHASWDSHTQSFYVEGKIYGQNGVRTTLRLSRFLEEDLLAVSPPGTEIDHISHDTLDDRCLNHRLATHQQNQMNQRKRRGVTSKYKGMCWYKRRAKWRVIVCFNKRLIHVGFFDSEVEAAKAYDKKAKELFRDRAHLNFPDEVE